MHRKIPKGLIVIIITILLFVAGYYYFTIYPKSLVKDIHSSLKLHTKFNDYLLSGSTVMERLKEAGVEQLVFRDEKNKVCDKIQNLHAKNSEELLLKKINSKCTQLCFDINPSRYIHGSFCLEIDKDQMISKKEKLYFWNEL